MKRGNIYTILFLSLILTAAGIFFYQKTKKEPIPPLLERQGPISTTSEWINTKAAIEGLQYKLRRNKEDNQSKLLLALAYMQEARITGEHPYYFPAAMELVEDILDQNNIDPAIRFEATVAKASIQLSLHQFDNALKTGEEALKMNDKRAAVYGVLCDAHVELGNYNKAIEMADKMTGIRPDLMSYARVSYLRELHGDTEGAIEAMEMAARAGQPGLEQTAWTKYTLGQLYEKTGNLQTAQLIYNQILEERPSYAFALGGLGSIETKNGNTDKAIEIYTKAANTLPEFSFQQELAKLYQQKGEKKKASTIMNELLKGFEEDEKAGHIMNLEKATAYLVLGNDPDKALEFAMKEYKARPNNIEVCKKMANIYYAKKDYKLADKYLQKALRTNAQDASTLCLRGLVDYKIGKVASGEQFIRKSFSIDPFQDSPVSKEGKALLSQSLSSL
jgi:tetratricopeptide (TPR) repeat protein